MLNRTPLKMALLVLSAATLLGAGGCLGTINTIVQFGAPYLTWIDAFSEQNLGLF
jgi:hypothetical protein